ncbi:hypothetical protein STCU_06004 [Strigomonas culicis]|uniref:DNA-directed RNA polymerase III subunit RPC3 n=1 Tax=Strigomonas culicis TaxID=28005 RepID=S9VIJ2_9TRYP|nr:hypothetical protein STCU_06004 [Strigomonas culicis]|eukprot:EPY26936.1 hypothetical protein STCU_06004 [Strigomonas culicis]
MTTPHRRVLTDHHALLQDALKNQLDPLAGKVVEVLAQRGPLTLKQISNALQASPEAQHTSLLSAGRSAKMVRTDLTTSAETEGLTDPKTVSDLALKEVVTRLVLHRVVRSCAPERLYRLSVSDAVLLRVLVPLVAQRVERAYGPAGLALFAVLHQLAVVPWSSAVRLAQQRHADFADGVAAAAAYMEEDGWVEFVSGPAAAEAELGHKRPRAAEGAPLSDEHCRLSTFAMMRALLEESLQHYVAGVAAQEQPEVLSAVVSVLVAHVPPRAAGPTAGDDYAPLLAPHSEDLSLHSLTQGVRRRCPAALPEQVAASVRHLSDGPALVETVAPGVYRLSLPAVAAALHETTCERVLFARYGTLGVRMMKLLTRNHFLEDKTLAEEAIATQPKTRELLHAMMRDGYVALQEVPRGAVFAERAAKSSTFLWTAAPAGTLLASARHVARSLTFALRRLHHQQRLLEEGGGIIDAPADGPPRLPSAVGGAATRAPADPLAHRANAQQLWRSTIGYQSSSLSLMRLLLVLDYL